MIWNERGGDRSGGRHPENAQLLMTGFSEMRHLAVAGRVASHLRWAHGGDNVLESDFSCQLAQPFFDQHDGFLAHLAVTVHLIYDERPARFWVIPALFDREGNEVGRSHVVRR